ncbi:N-acetylglutaminylglutamine synthetase [Endozoicomonas sp. SM1973]|uniref:N-acetylglutaminylglutamine synthetase n=1 Tax=Spartinivicinus marinus TaxID=2994442 RepID=A0A853HUJ0_9GAMM|nr:N-acetylglutaminylglutamine synthetase [Spartinivicinus marinus]MCX4029359.1 N-acetylglutaminylglutamine synthetase [Spartinivicinus marinus]NYZ64933.1 N-acetylglutaminylglutamine synthetase [Spartinivicinus marinus]
MQLDQPASNERLLRKQLPSFNNLKAVANHHEDKQLPENIIIPCGWGRLIIGNTFPDPQQLASTLAEESEGQRDIALYVSNPHVVLSYSPQHLFLDPSDTLRIWMDNYRAAKKPFSHLQIRRACSIDDATAINALYQQRKMVSVDPQQVEFYKNSRKVIFFVAEHVASKEIIGTVIAVNHRESYGDPTHGSSLWSLAVSPNTQVAGVGEALVRHIIEYCAARGCHYLDLSVLHSNNMAKELYKKIGFKPINTFAIKNKNAINEKLFLGDNQPEKLNPYAQIIADEAMRRGIDVIVQDYAENLFTLSLGGRKIRCHESLSDVTPAVSMHLCQQKALTHKILQSAGLNTPEHCIYQSELQANAFLAKHQAIVVKPANSEQGRGITVNIQNHTTLMSAIERAQHESADILLEKFYQGLDLRIVVIGYQVVAAAIRKPAEIIGDGVHSIKCLVTYQSRRRQAATGGESRIPIDSETERCITEQGYSWSTILPKGKQLFVCKTANLHTGGTLQDVTTNLSDTLRTVAEQAAQALAIPVVGLDFIVPSPNATEYIIIEANERPGLENHAPQPTAEKFIDLLFPLSNKQII